MKKMVQGFIKVSLCKAQKISTDDAEDASGLETPRRSMTHMPS